MNHESVRTRTASMHRSSNPASCGSDPAPARHGRPLRLPIGLATDPCADDEAREASRGRRFGVIGAGLVSAAIAAAITAPAGAMQPQSADDPELAGAGDVADVAELIPSAASGIPPILPGQEAGAHQKPKPAGDAAATGDAPREWFGGAPWWEWSTMTGDWAGARTGLSEAGIDFAGSAVTEWSDVFSGGEADRSAFRFLLDLNATFDLGVLAGLEGGSVFIDFQTGDTGVGAQFHGGFQAYSNIAIEGSITQVSQLWYEQWLFDELLRVKVGKVDANAEFAAIAPAAGFINASAGFSPAIFALPTYPNPATSVNLFVYPCDEFYAGAGLYDGATAVDGVPTGSRGPAGFFNDDDSDDWFGIAEAGLLFDAVGPMNSVRIAVGGWWHSGEFTRWDGGIEDGTAGFYALAEGRFWTPAGVDLADDEDGRGLWGFLQYGAANEDVSTVAQQFGGGVSLTGTLPGRDADSAGVYLSLVDFSGDPAAGFTDDEFSIEFFYDIEVTPWFHVKPDIQWFQNPGGGATEDALVGTLRCIITF